jgi:hypothetical protein
LAHNALPQGNLNFDVLDAVLNATRIQERKMFLNQIHQIGENLKRIIRMIRSVARIGWPFILFVFSFVGAGLFFHVAFLLSFWESTWRLPAVVIALDGIFLGANMVRVFLLLVGPTSAARCVIEQIQFSSAANLLLALFSLSLCGVWVSRTAAWSLEPLALIALQILDVVVILVLLRFLRALVKASEASIL